MSIEQIFNGLESLAQLCHNQSITAKTKYAHDLWDDMDSIATEALALLKTHPEAQPNQPLTLEELRKMDGQPVWVKDLHYSDYSGWWIIGWSPNGYCVLASAMRAHMGYSVENYGIDWIAYRRPPKEDAELMAWLYGDLDETIDAAEPQKEA